MATNLAVSTGFGTLSTYVYPTGYDPTKLGLGPLMLQVNDAGNEGKWVGPIPTNVTRPVENAVALGMIYPDSVNITSASNNNRYDWVLTTDSTVAAAATRKFQLFQFDRQARQNAWSSFGTITATPPGGGIGVSTYVVQGERLVYAQYTSANNSTTPSTVAINNGSPTLTGTSTSWQTDRMYIGSRIGIGTTDPAAVTQWYYISAISSDTSITLTSNYQGTNTSGQPYIIEDLRILFVATGTVAANSGLYMVAGISLNDFNTASSVIPAASAADKAKATYWLGDGGSGSNTAIQVPGGIAIDARTSWINQYVYCINNPALISQFQVNNFRGANNANTTLTFVNGRDAAGPGAGASWVLNTGQQAVTGAVSKTHNLVLATPGAGGGPRALKKTLFWVTVSRLYSAEVANIISASTTFQSGAAIEMPPGTTTTYAATGALASLVYSSVLDRFVVFSSGAAATHSYITQYREDAGQWDRIFLTDTKQLNQTTADPTAAVFPITSTLAVTGDIMNGNL